ncbi:MAG: DNA topoisomerase IB [Synechococcales cyanobacterium C42_A2020_086]|jgi:DNA topoisomerase-1|nr:DNA topoisomerase IB [Synechococcales cyanobacterium C42_A2020_086]
MGQKSRRKSYSRSHRTHRSRQHRHRHRIQRYIRAVIDTDPIAAAQAAGLQYVSDDSPGIRRQRQGKKGFIYFTPEGERIRDPEEIQRIHSLAIPPAYRDVWICPLPNGHLQATGRDAKGRKQYRYHPLWRTVRDQTKFTRMIAFSRSLPTIRQRIEQDLSLPGLPKEKVLAAVVRLMEQTRIRVGNEEYARTNQSYGLTTLQDDHVEIKGAKIRFQFRGKSGVEHNIELTDKRLAKIVKHCQDIPGQDLFQYRDEQGNYQTIGSADVNHYLKEIAGQEFTAKDFRTWAGTVLAATCLVEIGDCSSATAAKKNIAQAIKTVASHLGNRPATCRKYYVHPAVLDAYADQTLHTVMEKHATMVVEDGHALRPEELAVVMLLEQQLVQELEQKLAS